AEDGSATYYDGTYEGTGQGFKGDIKVSVTIGQGKITEISEIEQKETASYWEQAKTLFASIVSSQSADIDGISGATQSCDGIKAAVKDALAKAQVDPDGWYGSGEGTQSKPYIINTAEQLSKFALAVDQGENLAGKFVALGGDIDLTGVENWNPIGEEGATASAKKFAGTFDGQGKTITGMKITGDAYTAETNLGLFSSLAPSSVVKNLNMTDVNIDAKGSAVLRAGGIAGDTQNGSQDEGTMIDGCSVTGTISADSSGQSLVFAGGIIGRAMTWVKVANTWTDVDATAISRGGSHSGYAGGIYGMSGNNTLIVNVATFGDSYGSSPKSTNFGGMAGGLGGMLTSKVYNVYSMGNVKIGNGGTDHKWIGAIAGEFPSGGMTNQSGNYVYPETGPFRDFGYYAEDIALTIEKWTDGSAETVAADLRAAGTSEKMGTHDKVFETKAVKMARAEMSAQSFADTLNANLKDVRSLLDAYNYGNVNINNWEVTGGKVLPVGDKWVSKDPDAGIFEGGTGTAEDPYQIKTEGQLRDFAGSLNEGVDYEGYHVKVVEDIDISSAPWVPIGGQDYAFNGTFDGDKHTIKGMNAGTQDAPYEMGRDNPYMGFFGVLGKNATVKNLNLTDVSIYASTPQYVFVGGIAAINDASSDTKKAMVVDSCSVTGKMTAVAEKSNAFLGGLVAQQYRGAIINCWTDLDLSCTVKTGNAIAEVGGLVGLNNRGLVANCYTLGDVYGSASRNNGDEGMASTGNLVGVQAGDLVGSYSMGDNETAEYSVYAGELAGWRTGIGKVYSCYYHKDAKLIIDGREVNPPADFGTQVAPGVTDEGDAYVGGIVDELVSFTASDYQGIAAKLNEKFAEYPIDISVYGITGAALKKWKYDSEKSLVAFDTETAQVTYKQPQAEIVPPEVEELFDGTWYGRDPEKKTIVKITVKDNEVVGEPEVISGEQAGTDSYEAALSRAKSKALYGDKTGYGAAKADLFAGGTGTKDDPYLISNEEQLRAIAEALNEDEGFAGVYFKQTADIDVSSKDWLPIGHGILAKVKKAWTQVAVYPFLGNYDGDGHTISSLTIGTEDNPSKDPRMNFTAGLFGFVSGDHYSNEKITEDVRISRLENIKLRDVNINVASEGQNYTGGLLGNAQNGFAINNCSVTGKLSSFSSGSFARGAGLAGNVIRGSVLNSWTDVEITAETDAGNTYAGGLYAIDNRVTSINCYSLGSLTGNAAANNKVHIGGLSGQAGGVHYNCYTMSDVTSLKTTSDAGLAEGRLAGIAVDSKVYYSDGAKLTVAGTEREPQAVGVSVPENPDIIAKTKEEMMSQNFVDELNDNAKQAVENVESLQEIINSQTDLTHVLQFSGKAEDLFKWKLDGIAKLLDPEEEKAIQKQLEKLAMLKEMALSELKDKNVSDYSGENLDELLNVLLDAKERITAATSMDEIEGILKEAKENIDKIKVEKSDDANDKILKELNDLKARIANAKSVDDIESILNEVKGNVDKIIANIDKENQKAEEPKKEEPKAAAPAVEKGKTYKVSGSSYKVTKVAAGSKKGTVTFTKAGNKKSVAVPKTVKLKDKKVYNVNVVAAKAFTAKKIRTVTIGANVKTIKANAFAKSKAGTLILKTKKLTKKSVKGSLKASKVKTIKVKVGTKKVNKNYVKKYKKIFTKKNAGKKVNVKR
ncbi:MAG: FMN-binding protein, partial [Firmicutes bacterium]|nr:FMN-binding protein [Bacillota bacterium]